MLDAHMHLVGLAGYSGSGKTTLVEKLLVILQQRGQRVSVIKHAHHKFELDVPGKDSWRHRKAGAFEVLVASQHLLALQRETPEPTEYEVAELLSLLQPVDWVLVEGYRQAPIPKIEIWREGMQGPLRSDSDPHILAIATDDASKLPPHRALPLLDLNQPEAIVDWLLQHHLDFVIPDAQA